MFFALVILGTARGTFGIWSVLGSNTSKSIKHLMQYCINCSIESSLLSSLLSVISHLRWLSLLCPYNLGSYRSRISHNISLKKGTQCQKL